jgi:serine/threonine-protein kinase
MTKKDLPTPPPTIIANQGGPYDESTGVFQMEAPSPDTSVDRSKLIADRYEIVSHLGAGGMGQVVLVRHVRLGKRFALKLMQATQAFDPEASALFRSEAHLASTLCHPNIVSVVDFGEDPDWGQFIAMEFLEGDSLSDRIAESGALPIDVACEIAMQLASALQHSHDHQVVHSDVKAENVLCVTEGESVWEVKLLDFGTAQLANRSGKDDEISGTPEYMSPERIQGNPPAPSNDIYAVGVLLYEMLTGRVPFLGEDVRAVLEQHLGSQPEPAGAHRKEVLDSALDEILARSLAKVPEERYQRAAELSEDLAAYLEAKGARQREAAQRVGLVEYSREEAAADAFDALGIAAAAVQSNGTIGVANQAFASFLRATSASEIEGLAIQDTPLGRLHPGIREDIRLVAMTGKLVHRRLTIPRQEGPPVSVRLSMSPAHGRAGSCTLVVHSIPRASSQ